MKRYPEDFPGVDDSKVKAALVAAVNLCEVVSRRADSLPSEIVRREQELAEALVAIPFSCSGPGRK